MSRKTKIALPPGTELDFNDDNHRRHLEDEAFAEEYNHSRPTMKPPPRARFWWFWRMFGYLIFRPARRAWSYYSDCYYPSLPDGKNGPWTRRFQSSEAVKNWLWHSHQGQPLRRFLYWLFVQDYSICPHCGHTGYEDEIYLYDDPDGDGRSINMFELVEGGGVDYWGESEDAHGWQWCYRCGDVNWETT